MDLIVQRFEPGHPYYSDAKITHEGKEYQAIFGQCVTAEKREFVSFTMERRDTLIPEGTYPFIYYNSPKNGRVVLLENVPDFNYIEHHVANWPYELKGCTAHGLALDIKVPALISSRKAITKLMALLNNATGKITYEKLKL